MTAQSWDELDMVAWGELRHNYRTAEDVPDLLRACAGPDAELAAMRYLAGIPGAAALAPEIAETARTVLANPRRLASSGAWRAFTEDDDIRAAAAEFVTS